MIIYFTGTGNSRFAAKRLASALGDKAFDTFDYIRKGKGSSFTKKEDYIFVAPVYVAAPALVFTDFIRRSSFPKNCRAYFVMVCVGSMGASPVYCEKLANNKGLNYGGTAILKMPQNYISYFRMRTPRENREIIRSAIPEIDRIADVIKNGRDLPDTRVTALERILTPIVLRPYYRLFISAKGFRATEKCIGCARCEAVCPLSNIKLIAKRPVWGSKCTHCMACINLCPTEAIEYGKRTEGKPRYHGPDSLDIGM